MIEIEANRQMLFIAGTIGISRHVRGAFKPGRFGVNNSTQGWQSDCDGACGEIVVAKWLDLYYDGGAPRVFHEKDVGPYQVRTTSYVDGCLIIHESDPDQDKFILVLSHRSPTFVIRGWIFAREGKRREWLKVKSAGRAPQYFVPQSALRDMETFREIGVAA